MGNRRHWKSNEKAAIILQGIKGRPVSDICNEYGISNSLYYKWKDQFLANMHLAYEAKESSKAMQQAQLQNKKLKTLVADLTLELKKSDW